MTSYTENLEKAKKILDEFDLTSFLCPDKELESIIFSFEASYPELMEIFDEGWMTSEEFKDYVEERYGDIKFYEVSEWRVR